jgi:hypothetical protein
MGEILREKVGSSFREPHVSPGFVQPQPTAGNG